ncbi:MAG: sensor histidine kinase [Vicinamibacterales bacterium]
MSSGWRERLTRTFGSRLALWYFVLFATGVTAVLGLAYGLLGQTLRARDREVIESTLVRYATAFGAGGLRALDLAIQDERETARYEPLFVRVLIPGRGAAAFFSLPAGWDAFDLQQVQVPPLPEGRAWMEVRARNSDERLELLTARLRTGELFQVGKSTAAREELLERFRGRAAVLVGVIVVAALIGGATLTWSALRPLRNMTDAVGRILATGSLHARVPVAGTGDSLDDAAALMNQMLERIERLVERLRASLDNVAHDLRTPVTRLRASLETALQQGGTADDYRRALGDGLEEAERLVTMLDAIMDLAEAESGTLKLKPEPVDLAAIIRSATELYADLAEEKGIALTTALPEAMPAKADPVRLRQAIANLIDNALKYTPRGGAVAVSAAAQGPELSIVVADTGIGVDPVDVPHIWERLYRGDRSRSERGLGLGLSLVKAIAEAHGGRATVESVPGAGARFALILPA